MLRAWHTGLGSTCTALASLCSRCPRDLPTCHTTSAALPVRWAPILLRLPIRPETLPVARNRWPHTRLRLPVASCLLGTQGLRCAQWLCTAYLRRRIRCWRWRKLGQRCRGRPNTSRASRWCHRRRPPGPRRRIGRPPHPTLGWPNSIRRHQLDNLLHRPRPRNRWRGQQVVVSRRTRWQRWPALQRAAQSVTPSPAHIYGAVQKSPPVPPAVAGAATGAVSSSIDNR